MYHFYFPPLSGSSMMNTLHKSLIIEEGCNEMTPRHYETGLTCLWKSTPGESRPACPPHTIDALSKGIL
jgi:hypothetical protein